MTASCSTRRNNRGFSLPGCGCAVTVPTSTKPKPIAGQARSAMPFLSMPAASPTGDGKRMPKTVRAGAVAIDPKSRAAAPGAPGTRPRRRRPASVCSCATSASPRPSRYSTGRTTRSHADRRAPARAGTDWAGTDWAGTDGSGTDGSGTDGSDTADPRHPVLQRADTDVSGPLRLDALDRGGQPLHGGDARDVPRHRRTADLVCRLLLEKKKKNTHADTPLPLHSAPLTASTHESPHYKMDRSCR